MIYLIIFQGEKHELHDKSFNELSQIVFYALLNCQNNQNQFEEIRLITKSAFFYYKLSNEKVHFVYQEICKNEVSFSVWKDMEFWKYWVENELEEEAQNANRDYIPEEELYYSTLLNVSKSMVDLKIEKNFVVYCVVGKISKIYLQKVFYFI